MRPPPPLPPEQQGRQAVCWPPRISKARLRRLYQSIPGGLLDEALVDDIGISLLLRCRAILTITRARRGQVLCPVCDRQGREMYIPREGHAREPFIRCGQCGWEILWADYLRTIQRRQLHEGGAGDAFRRFVDGYPRARTPWQKMLAIDLLIHEFHYSLRDQPDRPTRAACVNLIEGRLADVVPFLNELSGCTAAQPELAGTHQAFKDKCARAGPWHPK